MPRNHDTSSDEFDSQVATQAAPETVDTNDTTGPGGSERRKTVVDRRSGLERRRGPGRRRSESRRTAEEGEFDAEQFEFVMAIDEYKRANNRPFPSWTEVLEVIKYLGYRKVAEKGEHVDRPASSEDA